MTRVCPEPPASFREAGANVFPGVTLREETEADLDFLRTVYASARADELAQLDWDETRRRAFTDEQFALQREQYRKHYVGAEWLLIEHEARPIGRLYVKRSREEVRLMEVTLLADWRGRGIGTALTAALLGWADALGLPVGLHVEPFNPAYRLYVRHGFGYERTNGYYHFLLRPPGAAGTALPMSRL